MQVLEYEPNNSLFVGRAQSAATLAQEALEAYRNSLPNLYPMVMHHCGNQGVNLLKQIQQAYWTFHVQDCILQMESDYTSLGTQLTKTYLGKHLDQYQCKHTILWLQLHHCACILNLSAANWWSKVDWSKKLLKNLHSLNNCRDTGNFPRDYLDKLNLKAYAEED